jgi:dienelactone hydrolase
MITIVSKIFVIALLLLSYCSSLAADATLGTFTASQTVLGLVGEKGSDYFKKVIDPEQPIEWTVHVPESYDPTTPPGLLVYVSPGDSGAIPRGWKSTLEEQNMIWIAANSSGNAVDGGLRIAYTLMASVFASKNYQVDKSRVYVSGLFGGGRVASIVAPEYAQIFKGAIFNCGVNFWGKKTPGRIEQIKNNRYVFVTGSDDFNRRETRRAYSSYRKAGVENVYLLDIAGMGHENPSGDKLGEAIAFLDSADNSNDQ